MPTRWRPASDRGPVDARYSIHLPTLCVARPRDTRLRCFRSSAPVLARGAARAATMFPKVPRRPHGLRRESPRAFRNGAEARTTARSIFRAKGPRPSMRPARPGLRWRYGNARRVDAARPRKGRMSPPRERPTTPPPRKMYPVPSNDAPSMRRPMSHPSVKLPSHALYQMIAPDINAGT